MAFLTENDIAEIMTETKKFSICQTCNHINKCVFNHRQKISIWYCNEFDAFQNLNGHTTSKSVVPTNIIPMVQTDNNFKGLCANCDHHAGCAYASTDTGIWHCNEYL